MIGKEVSNIKNKFEIRGDITVIFIKRRKDKIELETIVTTKDYHNKLKNLNVSWYSVWDDDIQNYYVRCTLRDGNKPNGKANYKMFYLHRYLVDADDGIYVDHDNHNSLDNTQSNLKVTKGEQNTKNRNGKNKNNKSGYRNVFWNTKDEKWLVTLQIEGKQKCFGRFKFKDLDKAGVLAEEMRQLHYKEFAGIG